MLPRDSRQFDMAAFALAENSDLSSAMPSLDSESDTPSVFIPWAQLEMRQIFSSQCQVQVHHAKGVRQAATLMHSLSIMAWVQSSMRVDSQGLPWCWPD